MSEPTPETLQYINIGDMPPIDYEAEAVRIAAFQKRRRETAEALLDDGWARIDSEDDYYPTYTKGGYTLMAGESWSMSPWGCEEGYHTSFLELEGNELLAAITRHIKEDIEEKATDMQRLCLLLFALDGPGKLFSDEKGNTYAIVCGALCFVNKNGLVTGKVSLLPIPQKVRDISIESLVKVLAEDLKTDEAMFLQGMTKLLEVFHAFGI